MIYDKYNYSSNVSYLTNTFIYEYDISKANINILYSKGVITKELYDYLYTAPRKIRQERIGLIQRDDKSVVDILKNGIIEAKKNLFISNNIQDHEVLSIKNDAVFVINRRLNNNIFDIIEFKCKNYYTSFFKINNLEIYYLYESFSKKEDIEIKGIGDDNLIYHNDYMLQFIKDLLYTLQIDGVEIAIRMLKDFYMSYISFKLPVGYYRMFNSDSLFHFKPIGICKTGFASEMVSENDKCRLDISYNISILMEFNKILNSIYFNKYK